MNAGIPLIVGGVILSIVGGIIIYLGTKDIKKHK